METAMPGERVEAIGFTSRVSEPVCSLCAGTGWRRAGNDNGFRRCECARASLAIGRLAAIPERFQEATFDSYRAQNERQARAVALMKAVPEGSWYMTGDYRTGKTHLLYAQYRDSGSFRERRLQDERTDRPARGWQPTVST